MLARNRSSALRNQSACWLSESTTR
jgi:hypothetical protein